MESNVQVRLLDTCPPDLGKAIKEAGISLLNFQRHEEVVKQIEEMEIPTPRMLKRTPPGPPNTPAATPPTPTYASTPPNPFASTHSRSTINLTDSVRHIVATIV